MKHRETHPNLDVDGCFGCKIAHVAVSSDATPTRRAHSHDINQTERRWHKDMDAYKRLRQEGLQPKQIDGAARVEAKADTRFQVESGHV